MKLADSRAGAPVTAGPWLQPPLRGPSCARASTASLCPPLGPPWRLPATLPPAQAPATRCASSSSHSLDDSWLCAGLSCQPVPPHGALLSTTCAGPLPRSSKASGLPPRPLLADPALAPQPALCNLEPSPPHATRRSQRRCRSVAGHPLTLRLDELELDLANPASIALAWSLAAATQPGTLALAPLPHILASHRS